MGKAEGASVSVPRVRTAASISDAESTHHGSEGSRNTLKPVLGEHSPGTAATEGQTTKMSKLLNLVPGPRIASCCHRSKSLNDSKESKG